MYCLHCGRLISDDTIFCEGCGKEVSISKVGEKGIQGKESTKIKKKTTVGTWILFIIVVYLFIQAFLYGFSDGDLDFIDYMFTSKTNRCKQEAQDGARSLRDKELQGLKLKKNPTLEDLKEIERLEIQQKTSIVDRDDYEYIYKDCMK